VQPITPCLWFNDQAEEAAKHYVTVFSGAPRVSSVAPSRILHIAHYGEEAAKAAHRPVGSVLTVVFELDGERFMGLNGGPVFTLSPAISFMINCETQGEVDWFWDKLSEGGKPDQCGWLTDRYGVSWQVVPRILGELMQDKDAQKRSRTMAAMLQMKKLDIAKLKQAAEPAS